MLTERQEAIAFFSQHRNQEVMGNLADCLRHIKNLPVRGGAGSGGEERRRGWREGQVRRGKCSEGIKKEIKSKFILLYAYSRVSHAHIFRSHLTPHPSYTVTSCGHIVCAAAGLGAHEHGTGVHL